MAVRMKPASEIAKMKRSKEYQEYLNGKGGLSSAAHNKSHTGDDWAAWLYGNTLSEFYDADASPSETLRIGYNEKDQNS